MLRAYHHSQDLPEEIPLFPLPRALLLPRGSLPLNIFEPRYLAMVAYALKDHHIIGMIQPRGESALYTIGCAGRITSYNEAAARENRVLITLTGICRFVLAEEISSPGPWRQARADYERFAGDLRRDDEAKPVARAALLAVLRRYLEHEKLRANWQAINRASDEMLVTSLAMLSPFGAREKQALLEAGSCSERCDILIALTEMALAADNGNKNLQ